MNVVGSGSVYPLDGKSRYRSRKWQLRAIVDDGSGKERSVTRTFPTADERRSGVEGTMSQAKAALADFIAELESPETKSGFTFGEYAQYWTDARQASGNYTDRTLKAQAFAIANVSKHIGGVPLEQVNATMMEGVYARLRAGESLSGRPLSGSTLAAIHRSVTSMMHYAESHGDAPKGIIDGLKMPKNDTREKRALSDEEASELLSLFAANLTPYTVCAAMCLACGLRRSESLAVTWDDIRGATLSVDKSLDEKGAAKAPKTKAGVRSVPIPPALGAMLEEWKMRQRIHGEGAVCSYDGSYMKPGTMTVWWQRKAKDIGIEGVTLHELRHTYLTMLARKGVHPRVMQELAGHETIDVTMRIYSHVAMAEKEAAVSSLDAFA